MSSSIVSRIASLAAACTGRPFGEWSSRAPRPSEALEATLARIRDLEQRVQLRELEQRLQVVVEVGEAQLAALLANLLRQRHEHAEAGAVDVAGLAEVD